MPSPSPHDSSRQWAYTDLSDAGALELVIDTDVYEIVQFATGFGVNEIPTATCLLAVGRDARNSKKIAPVHAMAESISQMKKAFVRLKPAKDWKPKQGNEYSWVGQEVIFDGFYVGLAYKKVNDRIHAVVHLTHWLIALTFSSTLDGRQHPSNSASLVVSAVSPAAGTGISGPPAFISQLNDEANLRFILESDVWSGIKTLLCQLANKPKMEFKCKTGNTGTGDPRVNTMAIAALKRIQGPAAGCDLPYNDKMGGMPLKFNTKGVPLIHDSIAISILSRTQQEFAHHTFWDAIVGVYCPMFNMAIIPQVTTATVIASTPGLNKHYDKVILPGEYDSLAVNGMISRPLYGVAILDAHILTTGAQTTFDGTSMCAGGVHTSKSLSDGDGMWLVKEAPAWLKNLSYVGQYAGANTGVRSRMASNTATSPAIPSTPVASPEDLQKTASELHAAYARSVYVLNMLEGRSATISGKLRFDIAPGSIIKISGDSRRFAGAEDSLNTHLYGHVVRVTIGINAESRQAGTIFQLSHVRTEKEFLTDERTHVKEHALFGKKVYIGAPLIENWRFP